MWSPILAVLRANSDVHILLVFLIFGVHTAAKVFNQKVVHLHKLKENVAREEKTRFEKNKYSYTGPKSWTKSDLLSRHSREISREWTGQAQFGNSIYFSGRRVLKHTAFNRNDSLDIPRREFTVEFWVKPEGGQKDSVPIVELYDSCHGPASSSYWSVGVKTFRGGGETDARIFFSLKADRSPAPTIIFAPARYYPNRWIHIAASYNGSKMNLFIDGAKVAVGHDQRGDVFSSAMFTCKEIHIGGGAVSGRYFRGAVDELRLWNFTFNHYDVRSNMYQNSKMNNMRHIGSGVLMEGFDEINHWTWMEGRSVDLIPSDIPFQGRGISLSIPRCGKTICDDPDVVLSYTNNQYVRTQKRIRYRIMNLMDEDGANPTVSKAQIEKQHESLNRAFKPYNITFEKHVENIRNTSLRGRMVIFGCNPKDVGDGMCQPQCQHARTGNDGGDCDCDQLFCDNRNIRNGRCDFECNRSYHKWDGGDCCIPGPDTHHTCYDPSSDWRGYISVNEYKKLLNMDSSSHLNVFFASTTTDQLIGLATFPWETNVYSIQGGTVVQPETFGVEGQTDSLVHEIGHNLGLWHVHHGISELDCNDPCVETHSSMELGDLCADTAPTPQNLYCQDPDGSEDECNLLSSYKNTPYRNYMSYADDNCTDHFSPQQAARMHCYLDLTYQTWLTSRAPSPVPLPPKIVSSSNSSVAIAWFPPFGQGNSIPECRHCTPEGAYVQYAERATSSTRHTNGDYWTPEQATGSPDAELCETSIRAWMPEVQSCTDNSCYLDLYFKRSVVPKSLTVWVTRAGADGIKKIRLFFNDGTARTLKDLAAFCDMPYTTRLTVTKQLMKVRIYARTPGVAIDAVKVVSRPNDSNCRACPPLMYKVYRQPPFQGKNFQLTSQPLFHDNNVHRGQTYLYWVEAFSRTRISVPSPNLRYIHGQAYCGDGNIDSQLSEECDDGNTQDGDGCNIECKMEELFHCKGSPSMCYTHDGDGICESFEKRTSVRDCGFYTPEGFQDQWANQAFANQVYQLPECPERVVTGPPDLSQSCHPFVDPRKAWFPCGNFLEDGDFWLEVFFPNPSIATELIVHIASDGRTEEHHSPNITIDLIKVTGHYFPLMPRETILDCTKSTVYVPVTHDLSQPFFKSKGARITFTAYNISISAVRLRSSKYLNPLTIASCEKDQVYNPRTGLCMAHNCAHASCGVYHIKHAQVEYTGYAESDLCRVKCEKGYRLEGDINQATCVNGHWESAAPIECVLVDCGKPIIPFATLSCRDGIVYGKNCTFKCNWPARLQGNLNTVKCEEDGRWSSPGAVCLVRCEPPLHVDKNAKLAERHCKRGQQLVGTRCKFRCHKGYRVEIPRAKRRTSRRVFKLTCGEDGLWNGPRCVRVTCPLDPVFSGLHKCTDGTGVGSRCVLRCRDRSQPRQRITCKMNGKWSGKFRRCDYFGQVKCNRLPEIKSLIFGCSSGHVGSNCTVDCKLPDYEPVYVGYKKKVKGDVAVPATGDVITRLICSGSSKWFPDPYALKCVKRCDSDYIGDGWCDSRNNREYCGWDGGDCCMSTLGGKVSPFPETCSSECRCKDPNAEENYSKRHGHKKKRKRV